MNIIRNTFVTVILLTGSLLAQTTATLYLYDKGRRFQADQEDGSPEVENNKHEASY